MAIWQVPEVAPLALLQARPVQQSADAVQAFPCGEHSRAGWQMFGPPSNDVQLPAQHWLEAVQLELFALQVPASAASPPSLVTGGSLQADPSSEGRQSVPAQQLPEPVPHVAPSPRQDNPPAQVRPAPPSALGRQGAPPQHWSLNWQAWPSAMQHGATPV